MNRASTVAYRDLKLQSFGEMQVDVSLRKKALEQVWAATVANEITGRKGTAGQWQSIHVARGMSSSRLRQNHLESNI
ncbi:hypothetical protein HETIRDRAFT_170111 [Heterobasidion irregulare TC 32-1]|uniref:Uncharacterized protein n=1 Tax=Heterobasidion irregulare (strain TC 32-1) TaxID=747525 RepID=W4KCS4_HETIT|nr:uncharacterized protein HETIRDRAFT_170111 [Heterobasidion irregulare TC 32-1]ETW83662.1 hypothetical protein HETIRDRAFT_170111 [Heterobasidion irregulare TC 32-1]